MEIISWVDGSTWDYENFGQENLQIVVIMEKLN